MILKIFIELDYDEEIMHGGDKDAKAKKWFFNEVLSDKTKEGIVLHSNFIGDTIGMVKIIKIKEA